MRRRVEPEILDSLPADDAEAIRSRRDLRWINAIMGNHRWLMRRIGELRRPGCRVLEIGAGDGTLGRGLVKRGLVEEFTAVDLAPRPHDWPSEAQWLQQDLLKTELPPSEIVIANLFLHHFEDLSKIRMPDKCRVLLCAEPARRRVHIWQGKVLGLLPLSPVTRHDMEVSIRAGFLDDELPHLLGLDGWRWTVATTLFGSYRLEAHRN